MEILTKYMVWSGSSGSPGEGFYNGFSMYENRRIFSLRRHSHYDNLVIGQMRSCECALGFLFGICRVWLVG